MEYTCDRFYIHHTLDNCPDPNEFVMHAHERLEIYCFISGNGTFWVEGTPYTMRPYDVMIFNSGEAHRIEVSPDVPYERVTLHINKEIFDFSCDTKALTEPFMNRRLGKGNIFRSEEFKDSFYKRCIQRLITPADDLERQVMSNVLPLLNEIYTVFSSRESSVSLSENISSKIIDYINSNITQNITPDSIAEEFFISRSYLYNIFKEITGSTVWDYITVKRLLLAKELLLSGNRPTSVYSLCGFNDYSSFYRAYKAKFAVSPKENFVKIQR